MKRAASHVEELSAARAASTKGQEPVQIEIGPEVFVYHMGELAAYEHRERAARAEAAQRREDPDE